MRTRPPVGDWVGPAVGADRVATYPRRHAGDDVGAPRAAGAQDREAPCPAGRRARTIRGEGLGVPARRLPRGLQGRRPLRGSRCPAGAVVNNSFMPTYRTFVFAIYHRIECC